MTNSTSGKYFVETETEVRFLDPVLAVELSPETPPPSLLEDPLAAQGLKQLRKMGTDRQLTVQLIQGWHGGAEDFHDMVRDSGNALHQARIVGVETDWQSTAEELEESKLSNLNYIFAEYPGRRDFQEEQIAWLTEREKIILPCDYPRGPKSRLSNEFHKLVTLCWQKDENRDKRLTTILYGAYQCTRQWLFLAQLGFWLHQLEQENQLSHEALTIPLMLGGHIAVGQKLEKHFGIPVENYGVIETNRTLGPTEMDPSYQEVFAYMTTHASITQKMLEHPLDFG